MIFYIKFNTNCYFAAKVKLTGKNQSPHDGGD